MQTDQRMRPIVAPVERKELRGKREGIVLGEERIGIRKVARQAGSMRSESP